MTTTEQTRTPFQERLASVSHAGLALSPREQTITPELVRWYREVIEDDHPWYTGPSPFGGPVAPALILHSPTGAGGRNGEWFLKNLYGNLHAKQAWEFFRPVMVGETVVNRALVTERYQKRDREFVVCQASLEDTDGALFARCTHTQSFLTDTEQRAVVVDRAKEQQGGRRFDLREGPVLETLSGPRRVITEESCNRFTGERRNYHNDLDESKKLGFGEIVVQGTYITCFISEMMTRRYGEGWFLGGRMALTFVNPLWAGEAVQAGGVVREITAEGPLRRAQLEVWTAKDDGTRTIVGTASALLTE